MNIQRPFLIILILGLPLSTTAEQDDAGQWKNACAIQFEKTGGRGSNRAEPLCACMFDTGTKYNADIDGLLVYAATPAAAKNEAFQSAPVLTRQVIGGCVRHVEKNVPADASTASGTQNEQKGQLSSWQHPDIAKAAAAMQLNREQIQRFRVITGELIDDLMARVLSLMKRRQTQGPEQTEQKMSSARRKFIREMNARMKEILTDEQWPAYENYRDTLIGRLGVMRKGRR